MEEEILVKRIIQGDQKTIENFYRRYKPRLLAYIQKKVESRVAEDILQETFLSALDSLPSFKGDSSLSSWLFSIARHEIVDYYRKKKIKKIVFSHFPFLEKLVSQALSPEIALEKKELKDKIKQTFIAISEGKRKILRLKYVEGLSVSKIARKLGITYKAAESRLSRARRAFQKEFAFQDKKGYKTEFVIGSS